MRLFEAIRLFEDKGSKVDWLLNNNKKVIKPIYDRLMSDESFLRNYKEEDFQVDKETGKPLDDETKQYKIVKTVLDKVAEHKFVNKNLVWFLKQYMNGEFMIEDDLQMDGLFQKFERAKNKKMIEEPDINKYNYEKFVEVLGNIDDEDLKSDNQKKKEIRNPEPKQEIKGVKIIVDTPEITIYNPQTWEAERLICPAKDSKGRVNSWCTYASDHYFNMYSDTGNEGGRSGYYSTRGPLFPFHVKSTDEWYQLHFESNQLKDIRDREVDDRQAFIDSIPDLKKFVIQYVSKHPRIVKQRRHEWGKYVDPNSVSKEVYEYLSSPLDDDDFVMDKYKKREVLDEEVAKSILQSNPMLIKQMYKPSIELQKYANDMDRAAFKVNCPAEVRRYVLEHDGLMLYKFGSYNSRKADGSVVTYRPEDYITEEDIEVAIKNNCSALNFYNGENVSPRLQIMALELSSNEENDCLSSTASFMAKQMLPETREWLKEKHPEIYKKLFTSKSRTMVN